VLDTPLLEETDDPKQCRGRERVSIHGCCEIGPGVPERQRAVLRAVLGINGAMFLIELIAGLVAHSTALLADSVDMLGDALVYGFSLHVVGRGVRWQARGALLKGIIMALFGAGVLAEASTKLVLGVVPAPGTMGVVGALALGANVACMLLLRRHRTDDINMRSAWLCSRNDVAANVGVLVAAAGVVITRTAWPDVVVGLTIAVLFGPAAFDVIRQARRRLAEVA
jgi:cation diffusion facilitator family transporter